MGHAARCPGHPPGFQQWVNASDLSFGLFQDSEPPENRDFLVYLGLLGLRGSPGTAQKQPESTKLGPRKSESLVRVARLALFLTSFPVMRDEDGSKVSKSRWAGLVRLLAIAG